MITYRENEDILATDCSALVNTVNCVGIMGAGLAKAVKNKFPLACQSYINACQKKMLIPGHAVLWWGSNKPYLPIEHILHVATKNHWHDPSEMEWVEKGIKKIEEITSILGTKSIAVPKMGCGLGGLNWDDVHKLMLENFKREDCEYRIYVD